MNTDGSFRTDYKSKQIYNDIYFVRGKGGGRVSLSSIKERMSRGRSGGEQSHLGNGNSCHQHYCSTSIVVDIFFV